MKKFLLLSSLFLFYGCSNDNNEQINTNDSTVETSQQATDTGSNVESSSESEVTEKKQTINVGPGGIIDPSYPIEAARFIQSFFLINEEIVAREDRADGLTQYYIGEHHSVLLDDEGYIYAVFLTNLYKNEAENILKELNIEDLSFYEETLESDTSNFENEHSYKTKIKDYDGVAVGLERNTRFEFNEYKRDKPFSVVIAFDEEYMNRILEQNRF